VGDLRDHFSIVLSSLAPSTEAPYPGCGSNEPVYMLPVSLRHLPPTRLDPPLTLAAGSTRRGNRTATVSLCLFQ
jgi:hypothetical protein